MIKSFSYTVLYKLLLAGSVLLSSISIASEFSYDQQKLTGAKPWTSTEFQNDPEEFQFVIIGDRTGGANVSGTFALAIDQLNLLQPEFVINVGDVIEGYSDDKAELNAEWDEMDGMLEKLAMPFFRTLNPGLVSAVFGEMMMEFGRNSSLGLSEWL